MYAVLFYLTMNHLISKLNLNLVPSLLVANFSTDSKKKVGKKKEAAVVQTPVSINNLKKKNKYT